MKRFVCAGFTFWGIGIIIGVAGCGGSSISPPPPPPPPAIAVSVSPTAAANLAGGTQQFTATVQNDSSSKGVTWTVSCSAAPCGQVSPTSTLSGVPATYTAPGNIAAGTRLTITATSVADSAKQATAAETITASPISVSISPATITVPTNASQVPFTATAKSDPLSQCCTWSITQCSGGATACGSLLEGGGFSGPMNSYTPPATPPPGGQVGITATDGTDPTKSFTATVTVVPVITVSVSPPTATIQAGNSGPFTAQVTNDLGNKGVQWTISCSVAQCGSLSQTSTASGVPTTYTAPAAPLSYDLTVTITATSVASSLIANSATITVPGIAVAITPNPQVLQAGTTTPFTATVTNDQANKGVTWAVLCSTAPCGNVSPAATASGVSTNYTAPATPPASDLRVTISASSVTLPSAMTSVIFVVPAVQVSVAPTSALLPAGATQQFTANVANTFPVNTGITWTLTQNGSACPPTACGTLDSSTANPVTYTAPGNVTANATVTLAATSAEDPSKSARANITLSTGTVQLVPETLDFGQVVKFQTSSPLTATLTNTSKATLNVSSIKVTGANPGAFPETDNCTPSVGIGMSCTITVTFHPTAISAYSAAVSISDSSADSPQQLTLTGKGVKHLTSMAAVRSFLAVSGTAHVPTPSGPSSVGTWVLALVDNSRDNPFSTNGSKRELLVRFWYPTSSNQACKLAEYTSPGVWKYFSQLIGVSLPEVKTNSCVDAPIADGYHPVVVFTPGYTATFTDYTFLFEDLASRGYVIASVNHTYEATAVEFPDGRVVKSVLGSHLADNLQGDEQTLRFAVSVRLGDLSFLLDELEGMNKAAQGPFSGKLDLARTAIAGHSLGGLTTLAALSEERRFKAGIVLDGGMAAEMPNPTNTPLMLLGAGRDAWSTNECRLWNNLQGSRFAVNLRGAEHLAPSDGIWLAKGAIRTGPMGPERTMSAVREYVAAFLDANLRNELSSSLLKGASTEFPDATVITQEQSLCGQP